MRKLRLGEGGVTHPEQVDSRVKVQAQVQESGIEVRL